MARSTYDQLVRGNLTTRELLVALVSGKDPISGDPLSFGGGSVSTYDTLLRANITEQQLLAAMIAQQDPITGASIPGAVGASGAKGIGMAVFGVDGAVALKVGTARWTSVGAATITGAIITAGTAPTGASLIVDVNKNGTTIFTTQANRPTIAIGANSSGVKVPDVTALADGDYITVDIDQIGSTVAGSDLTVEVVLA